MGNAFFFPLRLVIVVVIPSEETEKKGGQYRPLFSPPHSEAPQSPRALAIGDGGGGTRLFRKFLGTLLGTACVH